MKKNCHGKSSRYKALLLGTDFSQQEGIENFETFVPVVCYESTGIVSLIAAMEDLEIMQLDVKIAFIHTELELFPPKGYIEKSNIVYKLQRS